MLQRTNCSCLRGSVGKCGVCISSHVQFVISLVNYTVSRVCIYLFGMFTVSSSYCSKCFSVLPCVKCQYMWCNCRHSVYRQSCQSCQSTVVLVCWCAVGGRFLVGATQHLRTVLCRLLCVPYRWLVHSVAKQFALAINQGMCWT